MLFRVLFEGSPRCRGAAALTVLLTALALVAAAQAEGVPAVMRNAFIINEDNSHFFGSRRADEMTREGLDAFVDQYAGSAVTHLFLCPNAMRANFRSLTREAIWDLTGNETPPAKGNRLWPDNARLLHERGLDPYAVWIARCREKRISPWLSMRMNDLHGVDDEKNFMHASFWQKHPELWRVPHDKGKRWADRALNYAHPAVRAYNLAFVRELLERYDPDGVELDWMRFTRHLTPGREREEGGILTSFVREARTLTREWSAKRGHPIRLGVRVPADPDAAAGLGMDGVAWAREGLVDMLVPCPFWTSSDFDIPVELWKERLGVQAANVTIAAGLEFNARPWPNGAPVANDLPCVYGFAASARARGADAVYLFNFMDSGTRPVSVSDYRTLIEKGVGDTYVAKRERRFPVCYRDTVPDGSARGETLPVKGRTGGTFRIHIGTAPAAETQAYLVFGLTQKINQGSPDTVWEAAVNGQPALPVADLSSCAGLGGGAVRALRFAVPGTALRSGYNTVTVKQTDKGPEQTVVWAEIRLIPRAL